MNIIHTIILAAIEGITEFLPVSSTGHLILVSKMLQIPESDFVKSFEIFIQLGAIMAVVSLYMKRLIKEPGLLRPTVIAFIPTGLLGVLFYKLIKTYLLSNDIVVVAALIVVGAVLIALERYWAAHPAGSSKTILTLNTKSLLTIGLFQSLSMVPGVSRSAATIVGGMLSGLKRKDAVEFSFFLAVPTMAAATGLDLLKSARSFTLPEISTLMLGFVISWITALFVIKAFIRFVAHATFTNFGIYRILAGLFYWVMMTV